MLAFLGISSFVWSIFSEENRIMALVLGFAIFIIVALSEINDKIKDSNIKQERLEEKLKIHEQLIDIKKDIDLLKGGGK